MKLTRKDLDFEVKAVGNPEDRTLEFIGSTGHVDRYGDIIEPGGWDVKNYLKNPVFLWAHNYGAPPVGKAVKVKKTADALVFQVQFATAEEYAFADTIYRLYLGGYLKATSVGFQDLEREPIIDKKNEGRQTGWRYLKQELYELSAVPVPANPNALMNAVQKGVLSQEEAQALEVQDRGVIPFKEYPTDTGSWDGPAEMKASDIPDLKIICTWFDGAAPDKKGSYKLPHHRANGYKVVWKGVTAAMGALLGARGGVNIPDGDRKGCHSHLSKHYAQFEKTPPEFKEVGEYSDNEITLISLGLVPDAATEDLLTQIGLMELRIWDLEEQLPPPGSVTVTPEQLKEAVKGALEDLATAKGVTVTDYISLVLNPGYEPPGGRQAGGDPEAEELFKGIKDLHKTVTGR